jgi:hypothetical protein
MPSHSSLVSLPSTFRAPRWGVAVWLSSRCCLRSATSWGLALFSHRSASRIFIVQPGCIPSPMVIHRDDHQPGGGEKQAGLGPLPRPQLQGCSSSGLRGRVHRVGGRLRVGSGPLLPSVIGGEGRSPPVALSAVASLASRPERPLRCFRCLLLPPGRGVATRPSYGRRSRRARAGYVQVLVAPSAVPGGRPTRRTPRGRYSCSGTALVRTRVRTCRCALGRPPFFGAVLVGRWPLSSVLRWWSP